MSVDIRDDDPELQELVRGFDQDAIPVGKIFTRGPMGRTKGYELINNGTLPTFFVGSRRFILALDYAKFLLSLKRASTSPSNEASQRSKEARERRLRNLSQPGVEAV
jgi:hypothetical protein